MYRCTYPDPRARRFKIFGNSAGGSNLTRSVNCKGCVVCVASHKLLWPNNKSIQGERAWFADEGACQPFAFEDAGFGDALQSAIPQRLEQYVEST